MTDRSDGQLSMDQSGALIRLRRVLRCAMHGWIMNVCALVSVRRQQELISQSANVMSSTTSSTVLSVVAGAALASAAIFAAKKRSAPATGEKKWSAEELIAARRSIFPPYDETRPVPREIIEKMLESANWAPTHGRTEPWRFVVFSSPEARRRLGELEAELYKKMVPANRFLEKKYKKKIQSKLESSYVIAICMKRQESEKLPEMEEICSVACAVQNMHLVATGHGVGAYWSSGPPIFSDEMKEFLGLGPKDKCIGLFYVGYPKGEIPTGARKPMAEKVTWVEK